MRILISIALLLPILALGTSIAQNQSDYTKYHKQINQAEILISMEQYQQALNTYQQVFDTFDFVFLRDYKNAAQIALHINEKQTAFELVRKGITAGWELKSIKRNDILSQLKHDPEWKSIEAEYPKLRESYLNSINQDVRNQVHTMFKKDQRKALGALFRIGDKAQEKYGIRKFAPHSEVQLKQLIAILETHGYPGDRLIGNNYWMSTILSHHNSSSSEYVKQDTIYNFIKPKLLLAIERGQMSPYEYALIEDWRIAAISGRTLTGYGYLNPPSNSTLSKANEKRKQVGLRTIELRNKLVDIENKTGMNFYLPDWVKGKIEIREH